MSGSSALVSLVVSLALNLTLVGAVVALGVAAALRLLPGSLARLRYVIVLSAFGMASVVPVLATFGLTVDPALPVGRPRAADGAWAAGAGRLDSQWVRVAPGEGIGLRAVTLDLARRAARTRFAGVFAWLWPVTSLALLGRQLVAHRRLRRALRGWVPAPSVVRQQLAWPADVALYVTDTDGPSALGYLRPMVIIPRHLLGALTLPAVLRVARHELAHVRWRDPLANTLVRFVQALFWFSLPLWVLERAVRFEREAAADRAALAGDVAGGTSRARLDYLASLLSIAEWERAATVPRAARLQGTRAWGHHQLEARARRLLEGRPRARRLGVALGLLALLGTLAGLPLAPVVGAGEAVERGGADSTLGRQRGNRIRPSVPPNVLAQQPRVVLQRANGEAALVHRTVAGDIEEPILSRSEADTRAAAIERVAPVEPDAAGSRSADSWVMVSVLVDESGRVLSARAMAGNRSPAVEREAVDAARRWRFAPATIAGKPAKAFGLLSFFGAPDRSRKWIEIR